jgi:hypothetical protein
MSTIEQMTNDAAVKKDIINTRNTRENQGS